MSAESWPSHCQKTDQAFKPEKTKKVKDVIGSVRAHRKQFENSEIARLTNSWSFEWL